MLKDMHLASQIALSHYLDLGVTAAARHQLLEQMQWGHGDDDYSSVARKYLHEPAPAFYEEPQAEEQSQEVSAGEPSIGSAEPEGEKLGPEDAGLAGSQQPLLAFGAAGSAAADATTPVRRGFLK